MVGIQFVVEMRLFQLAMHLGRDARQDDVDAILVVHVDEVG